MVGIVAVDALVTLQALDSVPYLWYLLVQDGQNNISVTLSELVGQVTEPKAYLGILATHFDLDGRAAQMHEGVWKSCHL
jgi:hypothetical protein